MQGGGGVWNPPIGKDKQCTSCHHLASKSHSATKRCMLARRQSLAYQMTGAPRPSFPNFHQAKARSPYALRDRASLLAVHADQVPRVSHEAARSHVVLRVPKERATQDRRYGAQDDDAEKNQVPQARTLHRVPAFRIALSSFAGQGLIARRRPSRKARFETSLRKAAKGRMHRACASSRSFVLATNV